MSVLKILVLMHKDLVPPDRKVEIEELNASPWNTEYDVMESLNKLGHNVMPLGVLGDLEIIRKTLEEFKPHIVFNLLEEFDGNTTFDQHVVSYLELKKIPYTGCNPRGLTLARDKALSKKILAYHKIPVPKFFVVPKNQKLSRRKNFQFPLIVKSLTEEASLGISQASVVSDLKSLQERVSFIHENLDTDAIVEQYIEGRELYVGILGNQKLKVLPVWELKLDKMPGSSRKFATEKVKWDEKYREKYRIRSIQAVSLSEEEVKRIQDICKRAYKRLGMNGYARIDLRYTEDKKIYILEANPNPGIAEGEEFPLSAEKIGMNYKDVLSKILTLGLSWYQSRK
ncbi:MAG: D-alanine--D-alanine ligase family protein [Bacteriovoracaceae bacterium]